MKKCIMLATLLGGMVSLPVSADYRNAATDPSVNAVAVKVTIKGPPHVPLNRLAVTVLGEVRGARQAQVVLQRRDGAWRSIKRKKVGRRGRYVFRVLHLTHGEQVYRVLVKTDGQLLARSKNHHTHVHDFVLPVGPPPPPPPPPGDVPPPPPTLPEDVPPTPPPVLPDHPHHSERAELGARSHSPGASYGPWQCLNLVSTQFHQMPTSVGSAFAEQVVYWVTYYWFWNGFERQFYGNGVFIMHRPISPAGPPTGTYTHREFRCDWRRWQSAPATG